MKTILNIAIQITANIAIAIEPFMPFTAKKILDMLNSQNFGWNKLGSDDIIATGTKVGEPVLLFEKIEDDVIDRALAKLEKTKQENLAKNAVAEPQKPLVKFEDFNRMDIRIATVKAAEKVAKTKKLLKLTIDTGVDTRTIVSGIAEYYSAEEMVGKQVVVLINLEPRELKGILSEGMILMAQDANGKLVTIEPDNELPSGSTVG